MPVSISLGSEDRVSQLYSFKNSPSLNWTVAQTVKHWFDMTLDRDGLKAQGAKSSVSVTGRHLAAALAEAAETVGETTLSGPRRNAVKTPM